MLGRQRMEQPLSGRGKLSTILIMTASKHNMLLASLPWANNKKISAPNACVASSQPDHQRHCHSSLHIAGNGSKDIFQSLENKAACHALALACDVQAGYERAKEGAE